MSTVGPGCMVTKGIGERTIPSTSSTIAAKAVTVAVEREFMGSPSQTRGRCPTVVGRCSALPAGGAHRDARAAVVLPRHAGVVDRGVLLGDRGREPLVVGLRALAGG